jgi:hypothetical protein
MALLMLVATGWAVTQLTVLASWSRTVRFSTLLLVVAFGAYACGVLAVVVQWGWTRLFSAWTHTSLATVVDTASYTVDPVIEEVVKVLPLVLVGVLLARVRRQLGFTDYLLVGAATGAGFGLFESLMRFGTVRALTTSVDDGYLVQASLGGSVVVPRVGTTLTAWLPEPTSTEAILGPATGGISHLAWTALAGAGIGWFWRRPGARRWWGVVPVAYACADHMLYNYAVITGAVSGGLAPVNTVVGWVHQRLGFFVLAALVTAVILDRLTLASVREAHPEVLLPGERTDGLEIRPLWRFARVAPPWTALVAGRFVLSRRAALYASALDPADHRLVDLVAQTRAEMDGARDPARWAEATRDVPGGPGARVGDDRPPAARLAGLGLAGRPRTGVALPGGRRVPRHPRAAGMFRTSAGSWLLVACSAAGIVLLVLQLIPLVRSRGAWLSAPAGETVGRCCVRIGIGAGAVVAGVALVAAGIVAAGTPERTLVTNVHALDAVGSMLVVLGLALFLWGLLMFPPVALAATTLGTLVLVPTVSGAFVLTTAGAAVLGGMGVYLNEASESGGSSVGSGSGSGGGTPVEPSSPPDFRDPSVSPGPGWEWRGAGPPGSERGAWYNPTTRETLHPDLDHPGPIGPHYDWRSPDGYFYRVFPDGRILPR